MEKKNPSEKPEREPHRDRRWFRTTRWSLVQDAGNSRVAGAEDALAQLCEAYWPAVYAYVRSRGNDSESAKDLVQGFFAQFLEKRFVKGADRDRGKFRTFLLVCVKRYLANEWDRAQAHKRGGGRSPVPLDGPTAESHYRIQPGHDETPEKIFERRWAMALLDRVLARLEAEMERSAGRERFAILKPFLTADAVGTNYREAADELGMSEGAIKVAVHRLRRKYGRLLRDEVAQTVAKPGMVDQEIRFLFQAMGD